MGAVERSALLDAREVELAPLVRTLPAGHDALLDAGLLAAVALDTAVIGGDMDAARAAFDRYEAVAMALNGGSLFGCATVGGGLTMLADRCRKPPGETPLWLQPGEFLVTVAGMRCVVECACGWGGVSELYKLHAVDDGLPFLSESGFLGVFEKLAPGLTVRQAAEAVVEKALAEHGRSVVRVSPDLSPVFPWVPPAPRLGEMVYTEDGGQVALAL